jgi:hypothetical protein
LFFAEDLRGQANQGCSVFGQFPNGRRSDPLDEFAPAPHTQAALRKRIRQAKPAMSDEALIELAGSTAPADIAAKATVVDHGESGKMRIVRGLSPTRS